MMTTRMLDALMRLFALFAAGRSGRDAMLGRQSASRYLRGRLTLQLGEHYLRQYDQELAQLNGKPAVRRAGISADSVYPSTEVQDREAKILAKRSVKLLRTCSEINRELELRDRMMVFIRLAEFARDTGTISGDETFLELAASGMHIPAQAVTDMRALVTAHFSKEMEGIDKSFVRALGHEQGVLVGLQVGYEDLYFVKYFGNSELRLNSQPLAQGVIAPMSPGSVLRDGSGHSLFFSDLVQSLITAEPRKRLHFEARELTFSFIQPEHVAIHQLDISERSGRLVGIMGASGSGKSTLLNLLNGNLAPTTGRVCLNGQDVHWDREATAGCLGYIAQEDVLIGELSVRDNLHYSARLSLRDVTRQELDERVDSTLRRLGLWEVRNLRVGSLLDKTISGGQRKRLNIALELVREPTVLFVDEPTSGLSSRDSEQIMDLLKELTHRGQLVFVVIHQPSSDIFKLFDRLLVLDVGGYLIFDGNPLESVPYFKRLSNQVNPTEILCDQCGNVNPEQIFSLVEAKVVDEWGNSTDLRRVAPRDWYDFHRLHRLNPERSDAERERGEVTLSVPPREEMPTQMPAPIPAPRWIQQYRTFLTRDIHSKAKNRTYGLINFLEAPLLALLLAGFTRFHEPGMAYNYGMSENIPPFLFISVIVAFFMGLSVSAEEILRDRPLLRRERFLDLSWAAYLAAKSSTMVMMSLFQTVAYVVVSVAVMKIPGWAAALTLFSVLFSVSVFGNMLGLVVSSAFQSAKVIYILIPLLVIPQILFGGAIVRFDRFNPMLTAQDKVPWVGNLMVSRWGFEALAVSLIRNNAYDAQFVHWNDRIERAAWRRDFWYEAAQGLPSPQERERERQLAMEELRGWGIDLSPSSSLEDIRKVYAEVYKKNFRLRDQSKRMATTDLESLRNRHSNDALYEWVMQTDRNQRLVRSDQGIKQLSAFVHQHPVRESAWDAMLYVPSKMVSGRIWSTEAFNLLVLWCFSGAAWGLLLAKIPERVGQYRFRKRSTHFHSILWRSVGKATR